MVAGVGFAAGFAVDAGVTKAPCEVGAEQEVIEAQPGVALPTVSALSPPAAESSATGVTPPRVS